MDDEAAHGSKVKLKGGEKKMFTHDLGFSELTEDQKSHLAQAHVHIPEGGLGFTKLPNGHYAVESERELTPQEISQLALALQGFVPILTELEQDKKDFESSFLKGKTPEEVEHHIDSEITSLAPDAKEMLKQMGKMLAVLARQAGML